MTACVVGLVLLVLTPVFEKLPLNVMGAIVISGVSGLFEYEQALHLFKVRYWVCTIVCIECRCIVHCVRHLTQCENHHRQPLGAARVKCPGRC